MNIKCIKVGFLETNCYILEKDNECIIIDPGDDADNIISNINKNVVGIVITHSHFDHIGALDELKNYYKCNVYDYNNLKEGINSINSFKFDVIYFPGHMYDLISLYFESEKIMFVGDFIFEDSIGRFDLEGANPKDMKNSLIKLLKYDKNITLYPGHGNSTILKNEIDNINYYINVL